MPTTCTASCLCHNVQHSQQLTAQSESCNIDHHDTYYRNYTNKGQQATGHGTIINQQTTNFQYSSSPLEGLEKHCSHSAAFDSAARIHAPQCAESTRLRIMQIVEEWMGTDGDAAVTSSLFWLRGGAGAGKSALAQSLAEKYQEKKQLGASFFFFRGDATRNNGDQLIPTLVSHLVGNFEGIGPFVEHRIRKTRALFQKQYHIQIQELLVEPLRTLKSKGVVASGPLLIVIDGLDECEKQDVQCTLLQVISRAIRQIPYPLRFFITSRPEAHITRVFNHDSDLQAITVREYNLSDDPDSDNDIRKLLEKEFADIRRVHSLGPHLPDVWPDEDAINSLVERSSAHFIYAATVIRYIRSLNHRPDDRLEVILRLRPPREGDQPYAQLDALYTFIFQSVENRSQLERIYLVLGILYFRSARVGFFSDMDPDVTTIENLLNMGAGDLVLLLYPTLSLIAIDGGCVRILHKSLFDYLVDVARGGQLPTCLARVHELAANYILEHTIVNGIRTLRDLTNFAYHCRFGYLNDTLRGYLHSLKAPETTVTAVKDSFSQDDVRNFLLPIIWHLFRTLSREDFDSTGQVHEQYAAKWMDLLPSTVPQGRIKLAVAKLGSWFKSTKPPTESESERKLRIQVKNMKRDLNAMLMSRKPPDFNPMALEVRRDPDKLVTFTKREHSVFSAYSKLFYCKPSDTIFSSLVFGDYFIHSYDVVVGLMDTDLDIRIYSRHCHRTYRIKSYFEHHEIVERAKDGLMRIEKNPFPDFY